MYSFRDPGDKVGTISNLDVFMHRSLDTGFKTKWQGLWRPPQKLLDYYAYRINGIWLDQENLEHVEYGESIKYYFETESLRIIEEVEAPEKFSGIKSRLEIENKLDERKAVQIHLEPGIDIRDKSSDIAENQDYNVRRTEENVKVEKEEGELEIDCSEKLSNSGEPYIKDHYPGEHQKCMIPGEIDTRIELEDKQTVKFSFKSGKKSEKSIESREQSIEGLKQRTFKASVSSMENLIYGREGLGVIAGHPWFQSFWARDTFWTLLGLIDAGYFEESTEILEKFAEEDIPGKINLTGEDEDFERSDTYPLYIIASDKLRRHYGITEKIEEGMEEAYSELEIDSEGIVEHDESGTWMDTLERKKAVEIQSLWLEAARIHGPENDRKKLEKGLEKFESDDYIVDNLGEKPSRTINPSIGLMFDQFNEKYLSSMNAEFSSEYGARTRAVTDPGYESSGYHTGSTWGLTTCWAAMANFSKNKKTEGMNFLDNLSALLDRDQPGALPEVLDSETGKNLGCVEQAWSAGLFVHAIDSYLLGIEVEEDQVMVDPVGDISCRRTNKRVGDTYLDIEIKNGSAKVLNSEELDRQVKT
jgi:glycogen debranching enzyme